MKKLHRRPSRFKGITVGLDLHKSFTQVSVLDEAGDEIDTQRIASKPEVLLKLIDRHAQAGRALQVTLEASGCFLWAYDVLVDRVGRDHVHVAAPSRVRVIADSMEKNDENDAWWLAYLLWEGRLPKAFVAEGDLRDLRIASRELRSVVDERSDLKRRLKSHLAQLGISFSSSDWASTPGRVRIAKLVDRVEAEHGVRGESVARLWKRVKQIDEEVAHWRVRVDTLAASFDEIKALQAHLPGLGPQTAAVVWSELGDVRRYKNAKSYAKATGLTPSYRESGGRTSRGKITRLGSSHVRWALTRAVVACMRCTHDPSGCAVRAWLERAQKRKPKKAAIVAAARKLAEGIWRLFALGEAFDLTKAFGKPPVIPA